MEKKKTNNIIGGFLGKLWESFAHGVKGTYRVLTFPLFSREAYGQPIKQYSAVHPITAHRYQTVSVTPPPRVSFLWRWGKALLLRTLALPILLVLCLSVIVYASVRPVHAPIRDFPESLRLYYENAEFKSEDGTVLRGWFIPSLNAEEIVDDGDQALRKQRPAVVLCHGLGAGRDQLLPLAAQLNGNGFEVLLFDFRGCGLSDGKRRSFGLHERSDVIAAVHYLYDKSNVDRERIAVIGQDVGGVAALGAAVRDNNIRAVVIADVDSDLQTALDRRLERLGMLKQVAISAYMRAFKAFFRVHENQISSVQMVETLNKNQFLLLIANKQKKSLCLSAQNILKHSRAHTKSVVVESTVSSSLTNAAKTGPIVIAFLKEVIGQE